MAAMKCFYNILCTCMILSLATSSVMAQSSSEVMKGAYYPSWAFQNFPPSSIDTSFFTHIYYAFLAPNNVTFKFEVDNTTASTLTSFTSSLRAKRPLVKTLFSVGGASEGATLFSRMASTPSTRKNFVASSIEVARRFGFDGVDLDWEFPQNQQDMDNLGLLLDEWRVEVQNEAKATSRPPLLLSAAVYFSASFFLSGPSRTYPIDSINRNFDWINIMCYDYHGSWDTSETGAHAALFDSQSNISSSYGLGSWIRAGVSRSKMVMGLPLYGRTWQLKDPNVHGVRAPAVDVGPGDGVLTFKQIQEYNKDNQAKVVYDSETVSTYSVAGHNWIGYDDTTSVSVKIEYARVLRLQGYFFWAVNGDDNWEISRKASQLWSQ